MIPWKSRSPLFPSRWILARHSPSTSPHVSLADPPAHRQLARPFPEKHPGPQIVPECRVRQLRKQAGGDPMEAATHAAIFVLAGGFFPRSSGVVGGGRGAAEQLKATSLLAATEFMSRPFNWVLSEHECALGNGPRDILLCLGNDHRSIHADDA